MKAIILAAGRGSRMAGATAESPKCAMRLFGRRLLDHCVDALLAGGFRFEDIGIVTGYRREQAMVDGVCSFHNDAWDRTNMVASLICAERWLSRETCIVCYSDIVFHHSVIVRLIASEGEIVLPYFTRFWDLWSRRFEDPLADLESFRVRDQRLLEIGRQPTSSCDIDGQYMGLLRFSPAGWHAVKTALASTPMSLACLDMTILLQHMLSLGQEIRVFPTEESWLECDSQSDIRLYEREFADGFSRPPNSSRPPPS